MQLARFFAMASTLALVACGSDTTTDYDTPAVPGAPATKPAPSGSSIVATPSPSQTSPTPSVPLVPGSTTPPAPPTPPTPTTTPTTPTPPVAPSLVLTRMHMSFAASANDWLMSRVIGEGAPTYTYTGVQFQVLEVAPANGPATTQWVRCRDANGTHFQSPVASCENVGTNEGVLGLVYPNDPGAAVPAARPIYRCIGAAGKPIVATLVKSDCEAPGFTMQGIYGYAFPRDFKP